MRKIKLGSLYLFSVMFIIALVLLAGCSGGGGAGTGQNADTVSGYGSVSGTLKNPDGEPVEGAECCIYTTKTASGERKVCSCTTDKNGSFLFSEIPAGEWSVAVTHPYYQSLSIPITVQPNKETQISPSESVIQPGLVSPVPIPSYSPSPHPSYYPTSSPTITPTTSPLPSGKSFKWKVEAVKYDGSVVSSDTWTFNISDKKVPKRNYDTIDDNSAKVIAKKLIARSRGRKGMTDIYSGELSRLSSDPIKNVKEFKDGDTLLAHVVNLNPAGYVVVPVTKGLPPVIAYSFTSDFSWSEVPENQLLSFMKSDLKARMKMLKENKTSYRDYEKTSRLWNEYEGKTVSQEDGERKVYGPLFKFDTWDQSAPYNKNCPTINGKSTLVGCVALSLSQVLNFYQYPSNIIFTSQDNYFSQTDDGSGIINAPNYSASNINYNRGNPDNSNKAKICVAAGVRCQMNYGLTASSAFNWVSDYTKMDQYKALKSLGYWQAKIIVSPGIYKNTPVYYFPADYVEDSIIKGEPVILGGSNSAGGHSFNLDGYDSNELTYHMNMGWGSDGGSALPAGPDAWYSLYYGSLNTFNISTTTFYIKPSAQESEIPSCPNPVNGQYALSDGFYYYFFWSGCYDALYYNVYVWPSDQTMPAQPIIQPLDPYAILN